MDLLHARTHARTHVRSHTYTRPTDRPTFRTNKGNALTTMGRISMRFGAEE